MRLTPDEIAAGLAGLPGWVFEKDALTRTFRLPSFPDAVAFVTRLAFAAEAADHHPDMLVSYRNVTVTWTTHSAGGVTAKDLEGARETDRIRVTVAPDKA
jgi:4a-hydroxytetrahydrobiopterin dehydratase